MTNPNDAKPSLQDLSGQLNGQLTKFPDETAAGAYGSVRQTLASMGYARTAPVPPWSSIQVVKANEQRSELSLALDQAIDQKEWQLAATLVHAMSALARDINGFYGR